MIAWLGNLLIGYSLWAIGQKRRHGFLTGAASCICWIIEAAYLGHLALGAVEWMLLILYLRGWYLWKGTEQ